MSEHPYIDELVRDGLEKFHAQTVVVIIWFPKDRQDRPNGSGVLLHVGPQLLVATAGHVLKSAEANGGPHIVRGQLGDLASKPDELITSFRYNADPDVGYIRIAAPVSAHKWAVPLGRVQLTQASHHQEYLVQGCPGVKTTAAHGPMSPSLGGNENVELESRTYHIQSVQTQLLEAKADEFVLDYPTLALQGGRENDIVFLPDPEGCSGGPIWGFPDPKTWWETGEMNRLLEFSRIRLCGVQESWSDASRRIYGIPMASLIKYIHEEEIDLRRSIEEEIPDFHI